MVGRKNWLFAHSVKGANASAILYSLIETAKANGLKPYVWLRHVLTEIPRLNKGACIDHLLPIKKHLLNNNWLPERDCYQAVIPSSVRIQAKS